MKVEDLRIGNWVNWNNDKALINQILEHEVCFKCGEDCLISEIHPIPLTEEILLNCGFVKCSFIENHYTIVGMMVWKCNDIFLCDRNGIIIKNLNQLQNLYYSLTSKELKYNE